MIGMQFGVCGGVDLAAVAQGSGYEYLECSVGGLLKPLETEAAFEAGLEAWRGAKLPCPALNCFIPGNLKMVGPQVDTGALEAYVATVMRRAARTGVQVIVFGSGGARQVPEGWDTAQAWRQLVAFGRLCAPLAQKHGVTIVVEPLNRRETNIINSVAEGAALVREVDHPAWRLLVDGYHWLLDNDRAEDIVANGALFGHVHVATAPNRLPPGAEPCDLQPFFNALARAGYGGRISFEGKLTEPAVTLPAALVLMRRLADEARKQV